MAEAQNKSTEEAGGKKKDSGSSGREFGNQHSTQAENASENKGLAAEDATASKEIEHKQPKR